MFNPIAKIIISSWLVCSTSYSITYVTLYISNNYNDIFKNRKITGNCNMYFGPL